jgi:hypothetical protein
LNAPRRRSRPIQPSLRLVPTSPAQAEHGRSDLSLRVYSFAIAGAILAGCAIRAGFVLAYDFPLNDGGMFYAMVRDLQAAHYRLPEVTSYNGAGIPFAYSPLPMYAAAILDDHTPLGLVGVFRLLPVVGSTLAIVAFFLFARSWLASRLETVVAVFAFALLPRAFLWMIMGGGLTRSFGLLFAILAVHQLHLLYARRALRYAVPAAVLCALTVLSHLEMAWFVAVTALLFFSAHGRHRAGIVGTVIVAVGTISLTAPWWGTVVAQHGLAPFLNVAQVSTPFTTDRALALFYVQFTSEPLFPLIAALALVGLFAGIARREYLLPVWLVLTLTLDLRSVGTASTAPISLLAAAAVTRTFVPLVVRDFDSFDDVTVAGSRQGAGRWLLPVSGAMTLCYLLISALVVSPRLLSAMTTSDRAPMLWVAENTDPSSRFLVVSGDAWASDRISEWFPTLARRTSVATPQGYEWLPDSQFSQRITMFADVQSCSSRDAACVEDWSAHFKVAFDYVYVPKRAAPLVPGINDPSRECCGALRANLRLDSRYAVAFDDVGATIFRRSVSPNR